MFLHFREKKHKFDMDHFLSFRLRKVFKKKMGYELNLREPKTFSEKIQWLKIHYRDSRLTSCADKIAVRDYIEERIGDKYLIPLYHTFSRVDDIVVSELPEKFVLKPNNSSGKVIVCSDKDKLDWNKIHGELADWLSDNYFYVNGEWQYKNIIPKIVCERLLEGDIIDFGFFCFDGTPFICNAVQKNELESNKGYSECFYDLDFNQLELRQNALIKEVPKPINWSRMIELARILSAGFPFVRVDFRECNGNIYFGELTFTPANGREPFHPVSWDLRLGKKIHLEKIPDKYIKV